MTIHFYAATHVTERLNGGDMYDQLLAEWLQQQGHAVTIISSRTLQPFRYNDVLAVGPNYQLPNPDVLFCRPQHYTRLHSRCSVRVVVQHNETPDFSLPIDAPVIYVAKHLQFMYRNEKKAIVHGINRYHRAAKIEGGTKIAAVNLNRNKAGKHFETLCRAYTDLQFVGITGYGPQHTPALPNCEYREPDMDLYKVLHDCMSVISYSQSEGYPLLCNEVQSLGLAFIGTRIPGHIEARCSAYIENYKWPPIDGPKRDVQPFDGAVLMGFINGL